MSANMQFPVTDAFLLKYGATIPEGNKILPDPEYGNIELITPFCRLSFVYFDPPKQGQRQQDGTFSKSSAQALLMFNPAGVGEIEKSLVLIADNNFNPEDRIGPDGTPVTWRPSQLLFAPPGMPNVLINPLKEGTETWRNSTKPQLYEIQRGLVTLNVSMPVTDSKGKPQSPVYLDAQGQPCAARQFYAGCYARAIVRLSPFPRRGQQGFGKRGISAYLQSIQFVADGERLGSFNALAHGQNRFASAGPVPVDPTFVAPMQHPSNGAVTSQPQQGGVPGFAPPPQQMPGFAQPPQQPAPHYQPQPNPAYAPQQQPAPQYQPPAPPPGYAPQQQPAPQYQGQPIPPQQPQPYAPPGGYVPR